MDRLTEAINEMNNMFLRAKTPSGVAEGIKELNDANRAVLVAMRQKYGSVFLVTINGGAGVRKCNHSEKAENFCCDFCLPVYDEKLAELIRAWNSKMNPSVLTALYTRLKELDAVMLIWS